MGLAVPISTALDPTVWRTNYAHGIRLGPDAPVTGGLIGQFGAMCGSQNAAALAAAVDALSDDVIRWHLRCALSELSVKLGVPMGVVVIKSDPVDDGLVQGVHYDKLAPRKPYTSGEVQAWYRLDVHGPVISVERVRAYYFGTLIWEFSAARGNINLVRLEWPTQGSAHILPINFSSIIVTSLPTDQGNYGMAHTLLNHRSPMPDFWGIDYTIGPIDKETGTPSQLEMVLVNWVMAVAGLTLFGIAGMGRTQGITNSSVSFDGLSRSVGLSQSAQAGLYGALEARLQATIDRIDWKQIRTYKRGIRVLKYSR